MHPEDHKDGARGRRCCPELRSRRSPRACARTNGLSVWVETTGTPVYDNDGKVAYVLGTARDVSEREELRERVGEVDAMYRVADAIARATSLNELFDEAIDTVIKTTGAHRAAVLLQGR